MPFPLRSILKFLAMVALPVSLFVAWTLWKKPLKAYAPELAGLTCFASGICTDEPSKADEASVLKKEAIQYVSKAAGQFDTSPKMIFCTTQRCDEWFGFTGNLAYSIGASAVVVSTRGWLPHVVRHELVHCVR